MRIMTYYNHTDCNPNQHGGIMIVRNITSLIIIAHQTAAVVVLSSSVEFYKFLYTHFEIMSKYNNISRIRARKMKRNPRSMKEIKIKSPQNTGICTILPEELFINIFTYLSPIEQSKISNTSRLIYSLIKEVVRYLFFEIFGADTFPKNLKHKQVIGILHNAYLAENNIGKAKKILCWSSSKGYLKFIVDVANKRRLKCLKGKMNFRASHFAHAMSPLYLATRSKHIEIVEYLIKINNDDINGNNNVHYQINELCSSYLHTITHIAASKGYLNILFIIHKYQTEYRYKWDIDKKDGINAYSPLLNAILYGHYKCSLFLLNCGANVDFIDKNEMSLLYHAAENGYLDICELLLKYGANINAKSKAGKTALFIAANKGYTNIVNLLIDYGANVRMKSSRNKLPLYVAAENGHLEVCRLLLKHSQRSDLFTMTSYGTTPFFIATKQIDKRIKMLFKKFVFEKQMNRHEIINDNDDCYSEQIHYRRKKSHKNIRKRRESMWK